MKYFYKILKRKSDKHKEFTYNSTNKTRETLRHYFICIRNIKECFDISDTYKQDQYIRQYDDTFNKKNDLTLTTTNE